MNVLLAGEEHSFIEKSVCKSCEVKAALPVNKKRKRDSKEFYVQTQRWEKIVSEPEWSGL